MVSVTSDKSYRIYNNSFDTDGNTQGGINMNLKDKAGAVLAIIISIILSFVGVAA